MSLDMFLTDVQAIDAVRVARIGSLFMQAWSGDPTPAAHELVRAAADRAIELHPKNLCLLSLVRIPRLGRPPSEDSRRRSRAQSERLDPHLQASAIVFDVDGITGAAVRMFVSSVLLLSRPQAPTKTFSESDIAIDWLCGHDGIEPALATGTDTLKRIVLDWWGPRQGPSTSPAGA